MMPGMRSDATKGWFWPVALMMAVFNSMRANLLRPWAIAWNASLFTNCSPNDCWACWPSSLPAVILRSSSKHLSVNSPALAASFSIADLVSFSTLFTAAISPLAFSIHDFSSRVVASNVPCVSARALISEMSVMVVSLKSPRVLEVRSDDSLQFVRQFCFLRLTLREKSLGSACRCRCQRF